MTTIILTVQPTSNYWRLGLSKNDSKKYFSHLESVKLILTDGIILYCKAACGTSKKRAFDFNSAILSKWITDHKFDDYQSRKPTKLKFKLDTNKGKSLKFIGLETNS